MKFFITTLFISFSFLSYSCSCWGPQNFCTVITGESFSSTGFSDKYIIKGKKIRDVAHGMEIEILKTFSKQFEVDTIMVWGDLGWLCRMYTGGFEVGEIYYFNLHKIGDNSFHDLEQSEDYELSFCGRHFLAVREHKVIGNINDSEALQACSEDYFDSYLSSEEVNCEDLILENPPLEIILGPNPFTDIIRIQANQKISEVLVYDISGQLVFQESNDSSRFIMDNTSHNLASGVYILRINGIQSEHKFVRILKL